MTGTYVPPGTSATRAIAGRGSPNPQLGSVTVTVVWCAKARPLVDHLGQSRSEYTLELEKAVYHPPSNLLGVIWS